jgi:putative phage-type endonuclease
LINESQKLQRKKGLGGSDIAAILGVSPYKTAVDVYIDKTTPIENENNINVHSPLYWGHQHETPILKAYEIETGNLVSTIDTVYDKENDFLFANVDGVTKNKKVIVEAKTSALKKEWGEEGTNQIPKHYLCQVAHYASILDAEYVDIPVLFFGNTFCLYKYERNLELEKIIKNRAIEFWQNNVMQHIAPEISNINDAKRIYSASNGNAIDSNQECLEAVYRLREIKEKETLLKHEKEENQIIIQKYLKENDFLLDFESNIIATWKSFETNRFDTSSFKKEHSDLYKKYIKKTQSRRFNIK